MTELSISPKQTKQADALALVAAFKNLEEMYNRLDVLGYELEAQIGVPICMPDCGKCCQWECVSATGLEVRYIVSWLLSQPREFRRKTLSRCEAWLLDKDPYLRTYSGVYKKGDKADVWAKLQPEVEHLIHNVNGVGCPLLGKDKRCTIHAARPFACRVYGVTRLPDYACPRPLGVGEAKECRAHHGGEVTKQLTLDYWSVYDNLAPSWRQFMFMGTGIFMSLKPQTFAAYLSDNKIATAKVVTGAFATPLFCQEQLNELWKIEDIIKV